MVPVCEAPTLVTIFTFRPICSHEFICLLSCPKHEGPSCRLTSPCPGCLHSWMHNLLWSSPKIRRTASQYSNQERRDAANLRQCYKGKPVISRKGNHELSLRVVRQSASQPMEDSPSWDLHRHLRGSGATHIGEGLGQGVTSAEKMPPSG